MPLLVSRFLFLWLAAFGLCVGCGKAEPRPAPVPLRAIELPKPFHTDGRYIRDEQKRAVLLHGVNWSGGWKTPPFGTDATEGEIKYIASLGLNSVRLLTGWAPIMPEEGKIDHDYLANFKRRVRWAAKYDISVVVDMHQDVFGLGVKVPSGGYAGNGAPAWVCSVQVQPMASWFFYYTQPGVPECFDAFYTDKKQIDQFAEAMRAVIAAVGEEPNVIAYELLNEPFWGTYPMLRFDADILEPFYEQVYARIATAAAGKMIVAEPSVVKNVIGQMNLPRLPSAQTILSPHLYNIKMEGGAAYDGDTTFLDARISIDDRDSKFLDAPLWWGEWGNAPSGPSAEKYVQDFSARADALFAGRAYWDSSHLLRHDAPGGLSYVAKGLSRAYVERGPGVPQFQFEPASGILHVAIVGDGKNETMIRAPLGWTVSVNLQDGWLGPQSKVSTIAGAFLRVQLPPAKEGARAKATLQFTR